LKILKKKATESKLKRARICLHKSLDEKVQEMIIVFCKESYIRPHKHVNKSESFHLIEGELQVVFFDNEGKIINKINLSSYSKEKYFIYRLSSDCWHFVIPLSEYVIIHETTQGPFRAEEALFPSWAPGYDENDKISLFIKKCLE